MPRTLDYKIVCAIRESRSSVRTTARELGISPTTVQKWRCEEAAKSRAPALRRGRRRQLSSIEAMTLVIFRSKSQLSLDDCLHAFRPGIPHLTRSTLYRCFMRHDVHRLDSLRSVESDEQRAERKSLGNFFVAAIPLRQTVGRTYMFLAFDKCSRFMVCHVGRTPVGKDALTFLEALVTLSPYPVVTLEALSTSLFAVDDGLANGSLGRSCEAKGIAFRVSEPAKQWTIPGSWARESQADSPPLDAANAHARMLAEQYNCSRRLKTLGGRTSLEFIREIVRGDAGTARTRHGATRQF